MTRTDLAAVYRDYIACLNRRDWPKLEEFVDDAVIHNGRRIGVPGYRDMLERDVRAIPDLSFNVQMIIADPPFIASRIGFECTPIGEFLGLRIDGRRVRFAENAIYEYCGDRIAQVWSVIDKAAIETQL